MSTVSPSQPAIPVGWYRDPIGLPQYRWWDGFNWTNKILEDAPQLDVNYSNFGAAPIRRGRHGAA